jgi:DNA repair protein RadC
MYIASRSEAQTMHVEKNDYKYLKIHDLAVEDRPREKLISQGAATLSNAELLAILLGSGVQNMTSIDLAKHLLKAQDHRLSNLAKRSVQELIQYRGIGHAKAAIIASAMELSKRMEEKHAVRPRIQDSRSAYELIKPHLVGKLTEECWIMLVNRQSKLIKNYQISKGGLAKTTIDPKVIFKIALEYYAHGIILAHNHPSGNPNPSSADIDLTTTILQGGKYLDIKVLDHLIVTDENYFSFCDNSLI